MSIEDSCLSRNILNLNVRKTVALQERIAIIFSFTIIKKLKNKNLMAQTSARSLSNTSTSVKLGEQREP